MNIDGLRSLTVFVRVVQDGGFTAAAATLGVSTSAVSQAIRQLEKEAGVRLLNRTTRSVGLSEAGAEFYRRVAPLVRDLHSAFSDLADEAAHPAGTLRLTMSRSAYVMFVQPIARDFLAAYPDIKLDVSIDAGLVDIVQRGFDAGIRYTDYLEQDMVAVTLPAPVRSAVVAAPAYFAAHGTPRTPQDLQQHDCIRYHSAVSGTHHPWTFSQGGQSVTLEVDGRVSANDSMVMLQAALDGIGVACLSDRYVAPHLESGALVRVLEDWSRPARLSLYYFNRGSVPLKLRVFIDFMLRGERG